MLGELRFLKSQIAKLFESGNFIIFIGILAILPFVIISIFNNPSADDFCYNTMSRDFGYFNMQFKAYYNWSGRYFATAIMSVRTLVSGSFVVYKIFPVVLLTLLFTSVYHLSSSIFVSLSRREKYILTFLIMILYLLQMPSISQGIYWLAGSVTYQLAIVLSVYLLSYFIRFLKAYKRKYLLISIFLAFLLIGSNEISMMFINLVFGVVFLCTSIKHQKINYPLLGLLIFMVFFSIIAVFSPGSASRASTYPGNQQFLYSIFKTVTATKRHIGDWLPTVIISLFIFFEYFGKIKNINTPNIFKVKLLVPFIIVFSFPIIGVFPVYYSLNWVPLRVVNLIYFFFLLGLIYLAFVLYFKLKSENKQFLNLTKWGKYLLFILIFIRLGGNNNIRVVYSDLTSGSAYGYDKELRQRYQTIHNNKKDTLVITELTFKPKTIFFEDIKNNSKHWINQCYESYFNQNEIMLKSNME